MRTLPGRSALVLYGSETGNAQDIAEDLGRTVERLRFRTAVEEMNSVQLKELLRYTLVIFVISTTGQGETPQNATRFWRSLLRRKLPPSCLSSLNFTCFGLGDSSYPKYNWAARKLIKRLVQLGASDFFSSAEGDERHEDGIDTIYLPWKKELRTHILTAHPLPEPMSPIPDNEPLPPRFTIYLDDSSPAQPKCEAPSNTPLPIPNAVLATVHSHERVTPPDHFQDVRLLSLDMPRPQEPLHPGSTIIIYPQNSPADVDALIDRMGWHKDADLPIRFSDDSPGATTTTLPKVIAWCAALEPRCTLRALLTHALDIAAVPRRAFLEKLFFLATDPDQRERLAEMIDPQGAQDFYDYTTRPRRTILEILSDFPTVVVPPAAAADVFPTVRGREFSIANGGARLSPDDGSPASPPTVRVEVLAAMVEYRTIIRKPRVGLCSQYIKTLRPGARITVGIKHGAGIIPAVARDATAQQQQQPHARPVIAVAAGTGIAPIRMLHHSRVHGGGPSSPPGEMLFFFGCRSRTADFYFADEWERDGAAGTVTVVPAFSRESLQDPPRVDADDTSEAGLIRRRDAGRNYVQNQIRRHMREVADLVRRGAVICVCGSSGAMPKAVRLALADALVEGGLCVTASEAEEYLTTKVDIWQETW